VKRYLLIYSGPPTPPDVTHEGWPEWFRKIGDALVDAGSPAVDGIVVHPDGSTSDAAGVNGYSMIQAEDRAEAVELVRDHPLLALDEYTIRIFEVPRK
jgi:hypothetical protein